MKVCVDCECEHANDLERCPHCGGELRKRSISEAMMALIEEGEKGSTTSPLTCPRCDTKVAIRGLRGVCPNCGAKITKAADADGRPVLIRA